MSSNNYRVRRATVDDIGNLLALWQSMDLPVGELEKGLTEFQVVETEAGQLAGAIGLQLAGRQGRLHSEAFNDFGQSDALRQLLWERIQNVAHNHGLTRLWINESAPFWDHNGFRAANPETLQKLPAPWSDLKKGVLTLQLKEETEAVPVSLDKEFALFMESEKSRTAEIFRKARTLKVIATVIAIILFIMVMAIGAFFMMRKPPH